MEILCTIRKQNRDNEQSIQWWKRDFHKCADAIANAVMDVKRDLQIVVGDLRKLKQGNILVHPDGGSRADFSSTG